MGGMEETGIRGPAAFEPTRWSVVLGAQRPGDPRYLEHWDALVGIYWRPVYRSIRFRWSKPPEEAKDLTQAFFAALFDGGLRDPNPERGRFRSYLRGALENFLRNANRDAGRLKRGGGAIPVPLEDDAVVAPGEDLFEREWKRSIFERALERLGSLESPEAVACFRRAYVDPVPRSYPEIARELGLPLTQVTNLLRAARVRMRDLVRAIVRESCETEEDFEREMRELFG